MSEIGHNILKFIEIIRIEGFLADSYLEPYSISMYSFKGNNYLTFGFNNSNVYKSLQLNKYEIGKTMFDEVVRKVLNPLNSHISNPNEFFGYDITITTYTKSFLDKQTPSQKLKYQFLMPILTVNNYKDKNITGQGLIDSSIILLDDERIDLRLQ